MVTRQQPVKNIPEQKQIALFGAEQSTQRTNRDGVLLSNANVERALWEEFAKNVHTSSSWHRGRDTAHVWILWLRHEVKIYIHDIFSQI